MLYTREYLMKIAMSKNKDIEEWEKTLDPQARRERDLIRKAKNGDFMAMRELQGLYRNNINSAIAKAGLRSVMDDAAAQQEGMKAFKDLIMNNFKLEEKVKPISYITTTLPLALNKVRYANRDFGARKSEPLTMNAEIVNSASKMLRKVNGVEATPEEIKSFITDNYSTGKSLTIDQIKKIKAYERRELSSNQQVGGEDSDGAGFLTLADVALQQRMEPAEDSYKADISNQRLDVVIDKLERQERRFIRNVYGLGQFKNNKAKNLHQAVLNNGMSYYEGKKVLEKFKKMLKDEGII